MSKKPRFWRNVTLIALAHVALIAGLIRWSLAARSAPDAESLVWLSAGDLELGRSDNSVASSSKISIPSVESEPSKPDEEEKGQPPLTQAKSEIELPKPTQMETPLPKATAKPKATPKPTPKPTPKSTRVTRKRRARKLLARTLNRHPIAAAGKQVQLAKVAVRAVGATRRNSDGMAICCTIVSTAHGFSRRPPLLPAPRSRRSLRFESKKTGAFPTSKSSSRLRTWLSTNRWQWSQNASRRLTHRRPGL